MGSLARLEVNPAHAGAWVTGLAASDAMANARLRDQRAPFLFPLASAPARARASINLDPSQGRANIAEQWRTYCVETYGASAVDASMRYELHGGAGSLEDQRRRLRKKMSEAGLLLFFARQKTGQFGSRGRSDPAFAQKHRCGKCKDCLVGDCGTCVSCLDKRKFGGRGLRKQGCKMRRCAYARE